MYGNTTIGAPVQNIVNHLHELATVDQDTKETLFVKQFKVGSILKFCHYLLCTIQMLDSDVLQERKFTYAVAKAPENVAKNRYQNHLAG